MKSVKKRWVYVTTNGEEERLMETFRNGEEINK